MARNLDLTALRAFVTVVDVGGVTRAAGLLHLSQSAVSMQLKRLEESVNASLFDRTGRSLDLTAEGEQLLSYARRMLELNDTIWAKLTDAGLEGEITLGVPHDVVLPALPPVLQLFNAEFPRMKITLISSFTKALKEEFTRGNCDVILTTEEPGEGNGETLCKLPLTWVGAPGGKAWRQRPVRLAFEERCKFRAGVQAALDAAGIPWEMAVTSEMSRTIDATVVADLAIHARLAGTQMEPLASIDHCGALPDLGENHVNLYVAESLRGEPAEALLRMLRQAYSGLGSALSQPRPVVTTTLPVDFRERRSS
ncbi:LysR family transcriptional regulator [uncultured Maritimibacter sp.]|jgi:DNA-binding transcriptional LysR family regulator|uniref:LysR family transcriptional regulator n=1 Tax=uncultured Maritimibacter sp. TaxID=991866 RepID=UPI000A8EA9B6|nr:LysR family transcriptional regulator [uncultured Maritimibacter sp.]